MRALEIKVFRVKPPDFKGQESICQGDICSSKVKRYCPKLIAIRSTLCILSPVNEPCKQHYPKNDMHINEVFFTFQNQPGYGVTNGEKQ